MMMKSLSYLIEVPAQPLQNHALRIITTNQKKVVSNRNGGLIWKDPELQISPTRDIIQNTHKGI